MTQAEAMGKGHREGPRKVRTVSEFSLPEGSKVDKLPPPVDVDFPLPAGLPKIKTRSSY